jgi:flagellar hook-length control protein FliK
LARSAVGALARGESQFHLRLRPEGIGEVAVTIRARERELSLHIRASSGETRELILSQIDDLRGGLATGDYRLGELSVEVNTSGHEGAAFSTFAQGEGNREAPRQPLKQSQVAAAEVPDRVIQTRKGAILYRI